MKKYNYSIEETKQSVKNLVGVPLSVSINRGRKKVEKFDGELLNVYPSVFVVKIFNDRVRSQVTASYSDLICGDVRLKQKSIAKK